ncbi:S-layer homology domain-containing protein [Lutispora thermophila]|uniref:Listeria/Bacterioides repeat-containing protein n=1 Tax=Lutispora thermophila DSM 19022 TaxID=1122184 RepID=A0A1M6EU83_9FIRM|nr:S-layer homology domain-containing protein [Lutispora thermophila]SHI89041.1 Listeria/Bacterioides repeat-containing protein [Lutispora thermophila DSM 19022]
MYASINKFFSGNSANTFDPNGMMNRGMFVTVLGRMAGVDVTEYTGQSVFSDVEADSYYAPFVAWASKYGITTGVGNGKFNPNDIITREQMAVFFVRYFEILGVNYDTGANVTTIPADIDMVSPWAREMVLKLWRAGLLVGDGINFNPTAIASRAETAALCMRTDKAVKVWYMESGMPSNRISINPNMDQILETPASAAGSNSKDISENNSKDDSKEKSGNGSKDNSRDDSKDDSKDDPTDENRTTYYKVTFMIDSTRDEKLYKKDTLLGTLPNPAQPAGKVFLGWCYDSERSKPVTATDKLAGNVTLYAKFAYAISLDAGGTPNYISALDQGSDFFIVVISDIKPKQGRDFKFKNITAPDKTPETEETEEDSIKIEKVVVKDKGNGFWSISSANGDLLLVIPIKLS